jgi:RHS repeat-associated protein
MLDSAGNIVERYVYATHANVPEYIVRGDTTYRVITDHLGSVRMVVNAMTGIPVQRIDYDEYGNVIFNSNPGFQPFGFAGGLYESATKLVRFGARDYDAFAGRWTAKDPIGFEGGDINLFSYSKNNPICYTDFNGKLFIGILEMVTLHYVNYKPLKDLYRIGKTVNSTIDMYSSMSKNLSEYNVGEALKTATGAYYNLVFNKPKNLVDKMLDYTELDYIKNSVEIVKTMASTYLKLHEIANNPDLYELNGEYISNKLKEMRYRAWGVAY